jgi:hypothetical protein
LGSANGWSLGFSFCGPLISPQRDGEDQARGMLRRQNRWPMGGDGDPEARVFVSLEPLKACFFSKRQGVRN